MKSIKKAALLALSLGVFNIYAQENSKNIFKLNLLPIVGGTASVEFERAIVGKFSLNGSIAVMPKQSLPFKSIFSKITDDSSIIEATDLGAFSMSFEGRYYVNKKKVLEGVYVAPFFKYTRYNASTEVAYNVTTTKDILPVHGSINAFTGGLALGVQWVFANHITVDWRIVGLGYGASDGSLRGEAGLSPNEQKDVRNQLDDLSDNLPLLKFKNEVNEDGLRSTIKGPWAGIRTGLSIGYSF